MEQSLRTYSDLGRPSTFKDVVGHERWFEALVSNLRHERASRSHQPIALVGAPGVGKRTVARIYAKALICEHELDTRIDAAPCGACDECLAADRSSFALVEVDARDLGDLADDDERVDEQAQVNAVHSLIERDGGLNTAPVRIVVINNAEALTNSAADVALKTLELEISSSLYVFLMNDEARFSPALRSRCGVFRVGPLSVEGLVGRLSSLCARRRLKFDEAAIRGIARGANGSFGEALNLLARVAGHGDITVENLVREPEFGWGPTMLACWQAVLLDRCDEALTLFGQVGRDGPMRMKAIQSFLVACQLQHLLGGVPPDGSVSPVLDLLSSADWTRMRDDWTTWSLRTGVPVDEAMNRAAGFWVAVKPAMPWEASFLRGISVLNGRGMTWSR
jgi:DNA polymerase III gamma/tau subunit